MTDFEAEITRRNAESRRTELRIQIKWICLAAVMGLIILVSKGMPNTIW